jgi:hypothetical protein
MEVGWMDVRISRIFTGFSRIFCAKIRENPVKIREIRTSINPTSILSCIPKPEILIPKSEIHIPKSNGNFYQN